MTYLSLTETARALGLSRTRVHQLIRAGRIQGAVLIGRAWAVPQPVVRLAPQRKEKER